MYQGEQAEERKRISEKNKSIANMILASYLKKRIYNASLDRDMTGVDFHNEDKSLNIGWRNYPWNKRGNYNTLTFRFDKEAPENEYNKIFVSQRNHLDYYLVTWSNAQNSNFWRYVILSIPTLVKIYNHAGHPVTDSPLIINDLLKMQSFRDNTFRNNEDGNEFKSLKIPESSILMSWIDTDCADLEFLAHLQGKK